MNLTVFPFLRVQSGLLLAIFLAVIPTKALSELAFFSENYPPFNFREQQINKGIAIELLELMFKELKEPYTTQNIHIIPWPRAVLLTNSTPNSVLFSTFRTPMREKSYKWVGPIASTHNALIGHMSVLYPFSDPKALKGYRIGVIKDDIANLQLQSLNIEDLHLVTIPDPDLAAKMLEKGRIDLWAYDFNVATAVQKRLGIPTGQYEVAMYLGEPGHLYYAFNPKTDDKTIEAYQKALDHIKNTTDHNGVSEFQKILERYRYLAPDSCYSISGECWKP